MAISKTIFKQSRPGFLALSVLLVSTSLSTAAGIDNLRPHRAVYDLSLKQASDRSGITSMNGRIVYEMKGSKCEGFAVRFRFFTKVQSRRKNFTNDQRTTSFESGDGKKFSFVQQSYLNGQLEQNVRGEAARSDDGLEISLSKPNEFDTSLPSAIFMTQHIAKLIDAAKRKETFVEARVYDGSDLGKVLMDTTAVIGKQKGPKPVLEGEPDAIVSEFSTDAAWPVSVSYFATQKAPNAGERLPVYQVSFLMHESGVSRGLKMRYPDYSLEGDLKQIKFFEENECE